MTALSQPTTQPELGALIYILYLDLSSVKLPARESHSFFFLFLYDDNRGTEVWACDARASDTCGDWLFLLTLINEQAIY